MKIANVFIALFAIGSVFTFSNCGESKPTPEPLPDKQLRLLSQTWKVTNVTLGGSSQTGYQNMTLTITGTNGGTTFNYVVTGRPALSPWKTIGTWKFGTDPVTQLIRDPDLATDKLDMSYIVSDPAATLTITFNFTGNGYTRTDEVKGNWVFTFGL